MSVTLIQVMRFIPWEFILNLQFLRDVVPAQAGTHRATYLGLWNMGPRLRGDDRTCSPDGSKRDPGRPQSRSLPGTRGHSPQIELLEEIVAFVVDDDEGREVLHLDPPDRLHAELGIFHGLDLLDAVLGEVGRRAADRGEIEAAVLAAGLAHRG